MVDIAELKKAGLKQREAAVYLALLTLGSSSVQTIARKAKIARGTTYVILERLKSRGLVKEHTEKQRRLFVAEPPEQLLVMLEVERQTLQYAVANVRQLLPKLHALMRVDDKRLVARYYEGASGLFAMRQEMVMYSQSQDVWYNLAPVEDLGRVFGHDGIVYQPRIKKGIMSRTICLVRSPKLRQQLMNQAIQDCAQRKFVTLQTKEPTCGLTVFRDRIAVGVFNETPAGMIIESHALAHLLKKFFDMTWHSLPASS